MSDINLNANPEIQQQFTPTGIKLEGPYENTRNTLHADLYKAIIREVYGVTDVIIAHHIVFVREDHRSDGFAYQIVIEVPSADTLIFDHDVACKLWPRTWQDKLPMLALAPIEKRDALLRAYCEQRGE
jgi:hypothetical protein